MNYFKDFGKKLYFNNQFIEINNLQTEIHSKSHAHPHYELLAVLDPCKVNTIINGYQITTDYPFIMLVAPYNMHHSYYYLNDNQIPSKINNRVAYFGNEFIESFKESVLPLKSLIDNDAVCIFDMSRHTEEFKNLCEFLFRFSGNKMTAVFTKPAQPTTRGVDATLTQYSLFTALICRLSEINAADNIKRITINNNNNSSYINNVIKYIDEHIEEKLTIPSIATAFYINRDKLNKDFKTYTAMTVKEFIAYYRLNMAKAFLEDSKNKLSVEEIAIRCGFENDIYFYNFFKKHMGVSPRKYRHI